MKPEARAKEGGYKLTEGKHGVWTGNFKGIEYEDDDIDRLCDDMDAVAEIAESEEYTLLDEADEDGESIVEVVIDGDKRQFVNISVSAALAEAKEALLASKPKPSGRGRGRRTAAAAESIAEAEEARGEPEAEILPPVGGEKLNALRIDLRAFQTTVRELARVTETLRMIVDAATDGEPQEEPKKRGRGRGRGNGR